MSNAGGNAPRFTSSDDRAPAQGGTDESGHLTGQAVLDKLLAIRDASLAAWEAAVKSNDTKAVVAQSTSFERVAGAIKQQESINAIRRENRSDKSWQWAPYEPDADESAEAPVADA